MKSLSTSSPIQTITVGSGIQPDQLLSGHRAKNARGLYRRWGLAPRPEDILFSCSFDIILVL